MVISLGIYPTFSDKPICHFTQGLFLGVIWGMNSTLWPGNVQLRIPCRHANIQSSQHIFVSNLESTYIIPLWIRVEGQNPNFIVINWNGPQTITIKPKMGHVPFMELSLYNVEIGCNTKSLSNQGLSQKNMISSSNPNVPWKKLCMFTSFVPMKLELYKDNLSSSPSHADMPKWFQMCPHKAPKLCDLSDMLRTFVFQIVKKKITEKNNFIW